MSQYAHLIDNGTITNAKDFLTLCLRDFGVAFELRDTSLSLESIYNLRNSLNTVDCTFQSRNMSRCYEDLRKLRKLFEDKNEWDKAYKEYVLDMANSLEHYKAVKEEKQSLIKKYQKFINQIESWECSPDFIGIKKFAINQLTFPTNDCDFYAKEIEHYNIKLQNPEKAFEDHINTKYEVLKESIDSYAKAIVRIYKDQKYKKEFLDKFMEEINNIYNKE